MKDWRVGRDACAYGSWEKLGSLFFDDRDHAEIEERFLSSQADHFAGAKWEEKIGLLRSKWRIRNCDKRCGPQGLVASLAGAAGAAGLRV